jgi:hypothetical protein
MWRSDEVSFDLLADATDDPVVSVIIKTPAGVLLLMAEPRLEGGTLFLGGVHMHGQDIGPNALGPANLRRLAQIVMERLDCDEIIIEGAPRTTGAGKGRRPRQRRFARGSHAEGQP